jgi:hypothetical protein
MDLPWPVALDQDEPRAFVCATLIDVAQQVRHAAR